MYGVQKFAENWFSAARNKNVIFPLALASIIRTDMKTFFCAASLSCVP
jgi:hypothetical protein